MCLASVYRLFFPFHLKVRTLDSDSDTIESHLELPILCSSNAARYHPFKEYKKLPEDQREELGLWRNKRSNKNTDQGDGGGHPKKQKNDSRISELETQNKDLNDRITQILATVSAQGQSAPDPQNTNDSNRTNPNLVRIHRPPTQN